VKPCQAIPSGQRLKHKKAVIDSRRCKGIRKADSAQLKLQREMAALMSTATQHSLMRSLKPKKIFDAI
jgi:hypothetical protein